LENASLKYSRQVIALTVAGFLIVLAACDGGHQGVTAFAPTTEAPVASLSDATSKVVLKPKSLSFSSVGTSKTVTVTDKGYTGKIVAHAGPCNGIATILPAAGKGPKYKPKIVSQGAGRCSIVFSDKHKNKATLAIDVTTTTTPTPSSSPSSGGSASPSPSGSPTLGPVVATPAAATVCPSSGTASCSSDTQTIALSQANYSGSFSHSTSCNATTQATVVAQTGSTYLISAKTTPGTCSATFIGGGGQFVSVPVTIVGAVVASPSPAYVCPTSSSSCDTQLVTLSESNYTGNFTENDTCSGIATVVQQTSNTYLVTGGSSTNNCTATFTGILGEHVVISIQVSPGIGVH
jgi:hypothetical protein